MQDLLPEYGSYQRKQTEEQPLTWKMEEKVQNKEHINVLQPLTEKRENIHSQIKVPLSSFPLRNVFAEVWGFSFTHFHRIYC